MGLKYAEQRRKKKSAKLTFSRLICFIKVNFTKPKVHLEKGWNSKRMITEGEAAIPLETTRCAFRNQGNQNKDQL